MAFTVAGAGAPLLAADIKSGPQSYPDDRPNGDQSLQEDEGEEFCYRQRQICRKICNLRSRFDDRFDGCPQSCETRETRCVASGCYRWSEPEFVIAERFGGYKCIR